MLPVTQSFLRKLDEKSIRYSSRETEGERNEYVSVTFDTKYGNSVSFAFIFDPDGTSVNIKVYSIAAVSAEKLMDMFVLVNQLNYEYRWVKFYLDDDNEVTVSGDAVIDEATAGDELFELLARYLGIINEVYPRIMKVIWG